jgi:hypothetical protein
MPRSEVRQQAATTGQGRWRQARHRRNGLDERQERSRRQFVGRWYSNCRLAAAQLNDVAIDLASELGLAGGSCRASAAWSEN